ncbi:unnamed protein product [Rotaria sp. Silwood1]|nr:unnamed protein product [Rotaria sp. Silwood1]CAF1547237.1 unnamed protein product [Rotaria sp. Silwood1]
MPSSFRLLYEQAEPTSALQNDGRDSMKLFSCSSCTSIWQTWTISITESVYSSTSASSQTRLIRQSTGKQQYRSLQDLIHFRGQ